MLSKAGGFLEELAGAGGVELNARLLSVGLGEHVLHSVLLHNLDVGLALAKGGHLLWGYLNVQSPVDELKPLQEHRVELVFLRWSDNRNLLFKIK